MWVRSSVVNAEENWLLRMFALSCASLYIRPLFFRDDTPMMSFLLVLMQLQNTFGFSLSSESMELT